MSFFSVDHLPALAPRERLPTDIGSAAVPVAGTSFQEHLQRAQVPAEAPSLRSPSGTDDERPGDRRSREAEEDHRSEAVTSEDSRPAEQAAAPPAADPPGQEETQTDEIAQEDVSRQPPGDTPIAAETAHAQEPSAVNPSSTETGETRLEAGKAGQHATASATDALHAEQESAEFDPRQVAKAGQSRGERRPGKTVSSVKDQGLTGNSAADMAAPAEGSGEPGTTVAPGASANAVSLAGDGGEGLDPAATIGAKTEDRQATTGNGRPSDATRRRSGKESMRHAAVEAESEPTSQASPSTAFASAAAAVASAVTATHQEEVSAGQVTADADVGPGEVASVSPDASDSTPTTAARNAAHAEASAGHASQPDSPDGLRAEDRVRFVERVARAFHAAGDRGGNIRMRLYPPELGSIRVEIRVQDGAMAARVETESQTARNAILDNLPALRERLAMQDIKIQRFDVDLMDYSYGGFRQQTAEHAEDHRRQHYRGAPPARGAARAERPDRTAAGAADLPGHGGQLNVVI